MKSSIIKAILLCSSLLFSVVTFDIANATTSQSQSSAKKTQVKKLTIQQAEKLKKHKKATRHSTKKKVNAKKNTRKVSKKKTNIRKKASVSYKTPLKQKAIASDYVPTDLAAENPLLSTSGRLINQRKYFQDAQTAIKSGDAQTALNIRDTQLKDYPLAIWIDYWYLAVNMDVSKYPQVVSFIKSKKHQTLGQILKDKYIDFLSKQGQYKLVSDLIGNEKPYDDDLELNNPQKTLQCRFYEARWQRGLADVSAQAFANKMYMQMNPYPSGCSGLIFVWTEKGYLTEKLRLEKFERTYITRNYRKTTSSLASGLSDSPFSGRVALAMSLYDEPQNVTQLDLDPNNEAMHRAAVLAFKRFANLNPKDATPYFEPFASKYALTDTEKLEIISVISKGFLSRQADVEDVKWVDDHLPAVAWNEEIKIMRMRKAIWFGQWQIVYDLFDHLTDNDKLAINWRYWKARSALEINKKAEGKELMNQVAKDRSFFGFLAAQELGKKMPFNHQHLSKNATWPQTVAQNEAAVRFFEFRALNNGNASVEWKEVARFGSNDEAMLMAEWALSTGNISYAISSVVEGKRWDALDYRFPKAFLSLYKKYAAVTNVPVSFLYGISRQESMLNPDIKSPVGAVGLMQLMPATASMVSRKNNWSYNGTRDLVIPENNIRLGAAYLRDMLNKFDDNRVLAAAAYNAGPGRIKIWKSKDGLKRDTPMFVENIPFKETRLYVQNVLLYDVIYKKLLTGQDSPLLKRHEKKYRY